jgi:hypothetical protein
LYPHCHVHLDQNVICLLWIDMFNRVPTLKSCSICVGVLMQELSKQPGTCHFWDGGFRFSFQTADIHESCAWNEPASLRSTYLLNIPCERTGVCIRGNKSLTLSGWADVASYHIVHIVLNETDKCNDWINDWIRNRGCSYLSGQPGAWKTTYYTV